MPRPAALGGFVDVAYGTAVLAAAVLLAVPDSAKAGQAGSSPAGAGESVADTVPAAPRGGAYGKVRALDPAASALLDEAAQASPTVAALIAALGETDVLVLVRVTVTRSGIAGATQLVSAPAGGRILLVTVEEAQSRRQRIMYLGHELQHAREIAEAPDVRDQAALRRLMDRIGRPVGRTFETDAAIDVGWQVWRDVGGMMARSRK